MIEALINRITHSLTYLLIYLFTHLPTCLLWITHSPVKCHYDFPVIFQWYFQFLKNCDHFITDNVIWPSSRPFKWISQRVSQIVKCMMVSTNRSSWRIAPPPPPFSCKATQLYEVWLFQVKFTLWLRINQIDCHNSWIALHQTIIRVTAITQQGK